ncbi:MAG: type II secretion system protein GspL [Gammaproteobacteria bacterium]
MTETLLLRMPEADRPASWLVVDTFGNRMGQPQTGPLAEVAAAATTRRLCVCVPGYAVTLLHADIPTHNTQKIQQAVPFALEDKLAEDVETLHFAVGARDARGYPIAAVTRIRMRQWLDDLMAAGLKPAEMLPDMLALPVREGTLVLASDEDGQLLARFPDGDGIAADTALMPLLIRQHLAGLPEAQHCTHALIHAASDSDAQAIGGLLAGMSLEIAYRPLNAGAIGLMAATAGHSQGINLLQGEFGLHGSARENWHRWRITAMLLCALCVVLIGQQVVSEVGLRHQADVLDTQVTTLFHQALPDTTRIVDPRAQMQQRLKQLTGGGASTSGLLPMLTAVGATLQSQNGVQLQGFSFHGGSLQLQVQAASIDALNNMKSALAQNSAFQVNLDSVNSSAGQTTGRLTLSGSGG